MDQPERDLADHLERFHELGSLEELRLSFKALLTVHADQYPEKARARWYLEIEQGRTASPRKSKRHGGDDERSELAVRDTRSGPSMTSLQVYASVFWPSGHSPGANRVEKPRRSFLLP